VRRGLARVTCVVGGHPATAWVPVHPGQQLVRVLQVLCPPYRHWGARGRHCRIRPPKVSRLSSEVVSMPLKCSKFCKFYLYRHRCCGAYSTCHRGILPSEVCQLWIICINLVLIINNYNILLFVTIFCNQYMYDVVESVVLKHVCSKQKNLLIRISPGP